MVPMARPREFDRDEVLERAMSVFWSKGFTATSTSDLVEAMQIGRQSMYGSFGDKRSRFAFNGFAPPTGLRLIIHPAMNRRPTHTAPPARDSSLDPRARRGRTRRRHPALRAPPRPGARGAERPGAAWIAQLVPRALHGAPNASGPHRAFRPPGMGQARQRLGHPVSIAELGEYLQAFFQRSLAGRNVVLIAGREPQNAERAGNAAPVADVAVVHEALRAERLHGRVVALGPGDDREVHQRGRDAGWIANRGGSPSSPRA